MNRPGSGVGRSGRTTVRRVLIPAIRGVIERRVLVNYRVDPVALEELLPHGFTPLLVDGWAIGGICLIRLAHIRPAIFPGSWGFGSENAAHRIAVLDPQGTEAVFIPRRDTNSRLNTLLGGRLFPGEHHHASFASVETTERVDVRMRSDDGDTVVEVSGRTAQGLRPGSVFADLDSVSGFFERGSLGYSATIHPDRFDALELRTDSWEVTALEVDHVVSSFFDSLPSGTVELDNALLMRNIDHEWHTREPLYCTGISEA